ncbi:S8 family serine peptidase [Clostridium boliviensis]|uniref:S8 family serine peptidase n=1 Tax=Clostridium boliviensis TaxID=318465 RepID=A0ABU4GL15_9CLOT|nr:S8 family serine peptidase [Clostridium boliviensis]MDW2798306.1 S8 family serine peptidase [Clostridium boliviensis]
MMTIIKRSENMRVEFMDFNRNEFILWNEQTKSIYYFMRRNLDNHNQTFNLFSRLFHKNSFLAVLLINDNIEGLITWKRIKRAGDWLVHIDILIISDEFRGSKKMFFFIEQAFLFLNSCFEYPGQEILLIAETRYNSVYKYIDKFFTILPPPGLNTDSHTDRDKLMLLFYKEFVNHYLQGMYYNEDTHTIRLKGLEPADSDIYAESKYLGKLNLTLDEYRVLFCRINKVQIQKIKKIHKVEVFNNAKFLESCLLLNQVNKDGPGRNKHTMVAIIDTGISQSRSGNITGGIHVFYENGNVKTDNNFYSEEEHGNLAVRIIESIYPDAELFIVRALSDGDCRCENMIEGIYLAADSGADIISVGGATSSLDFRDSLQNACDYAVLKGCIVIAPRDIETKKECYPFSFSNVMGIGITSIYNMILLDKTLNIVKATPEWIDYDDNSEKMIGNVSLGSSIANYFITALVAKLWKTYSLTGYEDLWDQLERIGMPSGEIEHYLFDE